MSLNIGKRDVARMVAVLDGEYETVEDAARAALEEAFALYEGKAKFTIVGQMYYSPKGGWLSHEDAAATMVALGRYGTEKAALNDAESFVISNTTGEQFRAWVLPVHHGTPASFFAKRKAAIKAAEEEAAPVLANSMEAALQRLREQHGWITDEELAEKAVNACPECGLEPDAEVSPLISGREATTERRTA